MKWGQRGNPPFQVSAIAAYSMHILLSWVKKVKKLQETDLDK